MFQKRPFKSGHRGGHHWHRSLRPDPPSLPKPEASQTRIESINLPPALPDSYNDDIRIKNVEFVASFSWTNTRDPVILVPGTPPRWQPPSIASSLQEDNGAYHRDPNSARFPSYPLEPAIRAICETVPDFDITEVDIFGCGNTLGSLLSFARDEERTFRFGVEYVGSSLFLVRKTNNPGELIPDVRGYGHTFPEAYTRWDRSVKNSASHQRIIKYDFTGLKCYVRSESDGYLPSQVGEAETPLTQPDDDQTAASDVTQLLSLALGLQTPTGSDRLILRHAGAVVPQESLFDLKTRALKSKRPDVSVEGFLHRLWVNQIPNMILAYHNYGKFEPSNIHVVDARSKVSEWEVANVEALSKFGGLLHKLIEVSREDSRRCIEVRRIGSGPLEIWSETPQWSALSFDLKQSLGLSRAQDTALDNEGDGRKEAESSSDDEDSDDEDYLKF